MKKIGIFGTSGFATEIADICDAIGITEIVFISNDESTVGTFTNGIPLVSESTVDELRKREFQFALGMASPKLKEKTAKKFSNLNFANLVHPSASFGRKQSELLLNCKGLVVAAGARLMSNILVGDFVAVGLNATVGHDCTLGSFVSIMPGANISGNVSIQDGVYVGSGAVVLQGTSTGKLILGRALVVGAGAVVTKSFEEAGTVVGVPAMKIK